MNHTHSVIFVADNSGASEVLCFRNLKKSKKPIKIGDVLVGVVKKSKSNGIVQKSKIVRGVVIRSKSSFLRTNGSRIKFEKSALVLIDSENNPIGSRVFGPVISEIRELGYSKIASISEIII
jgi:large subunit ribosomal protein L14